MKRQAALRGRKGQKGSCKYDIAFKRRVANDYINGDRSLKQLGQIYNVRFQAISDWAKEFSSELSQTRKAIVVTDQEQNETTELQKQLEILKAKLEYEQMKNFALETMIDLAKSELGVDLRKNSGAKQPKE